MVKTKTSNRSLTPYEVQRIILGILLVGLVIAGIVFVYQTRSDQDSIGEAIIIEENQDPMVPTAPSTGNEGEE